MFAALTTATFAVGEALDNKPIRILGCVMTCLLICAWFAIFTMMIRAVIVKDILWPQKQEDREEGGWKMHPGEKQACDPRRCSSDAPVMSNGLNTTSNSVRTANGKQRENTDSGFEDGSDPGSGHGGDAQHDWRPPVETAADRFVDEVVRGTGYRKTEDMV